MTVCFFHKLFSVAVMSFMACPVSGQGVTYNHDASVMNQFTIGETGVGSFTPDLYYDLFHENYRNSAMATNKLWYRTAMTLSLRQQEPYAESLDSALVERQRVELKNIADRSPGVGDVAWQVERGKIEGKRDILKKNIERITVYGGSVESYHQWLERYNAIQCGIDAIRNSYMPQGSRKEQYLAVYKDILVKNVEVCQYLQHLRGLQEARKHTGNTVRQVMPLDSSQVGRIARSSHGRWKISLAAVSGGPDVREETADYRWHRIRYE